MKKQWIVAGAAIGAVLVAGRCASKCGGLDFEKLVDRMPDDAPPKWMFRNITAIRENTDRILRLIESMSGPVVNEAVHAQA